MANYVENIRHGCNLLFRLSSEVQDIDPRLLCGNVLLSAADAGCVLARCGAF